MLRTALLLALAVSLAACDAAGPEDTPLPESPSGPTMANVSINLDQIRVLGDCENSPSNPGDFQFKISFVDEGNQRVGPELQFPNGTYGDNSGQNHLTLLTGRTHGVNQTATLQRPAQEGSAFGVVFAATEWDSATTRDSRMDDRTNTRLYAYREGRFQGITGSQSVSLNGGTDCSVRLEYTIAVG
ncbi:hypothetical protein [Rubrivirga sp. IMCC45206]|uniref:hypothetical protein n=1 Tax=Rubrivirga sp. IMCC45206 TaxID=3391614 RepID=UPI00399001AC